MSFIQTVTGRILQEEMGVTYSHDHLLFIPPQSIIEKDTTLQLNNLGNSLHEAECFKMAGGNCVVEMSTVDTSRSAIGLKTISEKAGIRIIAATGFNKNLFCESWVADKSVKEISKQMIDDLLIGMDGTDIKSGVIKASSSKNTIYPGEEKVFQAAIIAHHETGATISTHTEAGTMALEQIQLFRKDNVNAESIVIGHLDRKLEWDYLLQIAQTGVFMSFDQISKEKYYPDALRIEMIKRLIQAGFSSQIILAGDLARMTYLPSYGFGYGPGYTYILWRFIPWMIEEGISIENINKMMIENPAVAFAWKK